MQKIVSLVPSQTELLFDLGLNEEVVGITKFCVHPQDWFRTKTRLGGTKNIDIEKVKSLQPDLVIANKEENVKEQIDVLRQFTKVYVSDVVDLNSAEQMIIEIGDLVDKKNNAEVIVDDINTAFMQLKKEDSAKHSAAYFIWNNPYMVAGGDTFINDMMEYAGCKNIFQNKYRYPETNIAELKELNCEFILLSSEPFPFKQKHVDALQAQLPHTKIMLVDGEMFSWYGSRLLKAANYFLQLKQKMQMFIWLSISIIFFII